eukprot:CAMPEP_0113686260 /NCGR_PEP_ID=MMETSP0038_2-20120614/15178_1 /TAXON_ID=2898 /ORGANISM="Cryptomonas paramecium" /LENGTH=1123 /DNA_ID=CAMNT_0000606537 /DNA_START=21 /DNA_END=3392 /DNA_ORIENTATION=- /assembly_acc=CAM_ASM_000170
MTGTANAAAAATATGPGPIATAALGTTTALRASGEHQRHIQPQVIAATTVTLSEQIRRISVEVQRQAGEDSPRGEGNSDFKPSHGLTTAEADVLMKQWGRNELVEKVTPTWLIIFRLLTGPMPIMLWIAALIEGVIENFADMGILLGIQFINAGISFYETTKAGNAVAALKASLKPLATVKRDGKWQTVEAGIIVPGDLVKLAAGSAVPADCYVNEGEIEVDQSAMTGESLPVKFRPGDICKMGSTVTRGETDGTVETTGQHTFFGKTAAMIQSVENVGGSLQTLLLNMMTVLVTLSLTLCIIAFVYLLVEGRNENNDAPEILKIDDSKIVKEALSFAVVVLVASIPLAVEIVTTTTLAMGSRSLSHHGAIVTRLASIEEMAGMDMLCSDKTGTLTLNKMVIQDDCPVFQPGEDKQSIMLQAALAAKWTEPPRDALDTMVLKTGLKLPQAEDAVKDPEGITNLAKLNEYKQLDFMPFDPRSKRTEGKLQAPDGHVFRITKGAPHVILNMCHNKDEIKDQVDSKVHELGTRGIRSLAIARMDNEDNKWRFLGIMTFLDPPRPDTKHTIEQANLFGVEVKMITGDHKTIAVETARVLGMGTLIQGPEGLPVLDAEGKAPASLPENYGALIVPSCGFAQVFPEHKYLIVECLRQVGYRCGMTGDGVNDAPALKRADVGIAVQGATDAARAAADIVLTHEGLSVCIEAIKIAREIFARLKNFINYRISATLQLLVFFFIAVFALPPRQYYDNNGIHGFVLISNDPAIGGNPQHDILKKIQVFNIPRKDWKCSTGYEGENDTRFTPYKRTLTIRDQHNTTIYDQSWDIQPGPDSSTDQRTLVYYDVDSMSPKNPFHNKTNVPPLDLGCNIELPICEKSTDCINGKVGPCPEYDKCDGWPHFFQLPVLMLMLITLLNDGALISIGYDFVKPNPAPERWNFPLIFCVSCMLGAVACGSSLLLLWAALDSNNRNGVFAGMGIPPMEYGKIINMIYLKVSLSDFLTLFSARTQTEFFFQVRPGGLLLGAALISLIISTFLASFWPEGILDGLPVKGLALGDYSLMPLWIWIYCIIWWIVQDVLKVITIRLLMAMPAFKPFAVDRPYYDEENKKVREKLAKEAELAPPKAGGH